MPGTDLMWHSLRIGTRILLPLRSLRWGMKLPVQASILAVFGAHRVVNSLPGKKLLKATTFPQPYRHSGGTASPSGRYGVRSRSRPPDQALRVLAASGEAAVSQIRAWHESDVDYSFTYSGTFDALHRTNHHFKHLKWWFVWVMWTEDSKLQKYFF